MINRENVHIRFLPHKTRIRYPRAALPKDINEYGLPPLSPKRNVEKKLQSHWLKFSCSFKLNFWTYGHTNQSICRTILWTACKRFGIPCQVSHKWVLIAQKNEFPYCDTWDNNAKRISAQLEIAPSHCSSFLSSITPSLASGFCHQIFAPVY